MSGAKSLRFGGKIFGQQKDYWIAIGSLPQAEEDSKDASVEPRGKGVNELVFWVTDSLLNDWIQLPDCRPEHIIQARLIKHVFTGNLNAEIDSNPTFCGKERHLLRATLARIFSATAVCPKGLLALDEETNEVKFAEEFAMPKTEELKSLESWSNMHPIILKAGRTTHKAPAGMGEEDAAAYMEEQEGKDPTVERFRGLNEHAQYPGEQPCWFSRVVGDTQQYAEGGAEGENVSYAVNVIKSIRWPGAVTVAKGGKFCCIYVGYGLKKGDPSYNPIEPPEVCQDPEEEEDQPEPNPPTEPPTDIEPNTDAPDGNPDDQ